MRMKKNEYFVSIDKKGTMKGEVFSRRQIRWFPAKMSEIDKNVKEGTGFILKKKW